MANILCRTKGDALPKGKPRVYFTCHPKDFERYFDKVCEDIFKTHDCAIYYTEDMAEVIPEEDKETDLESNHLFVIPVTFKLLTTENRAMDQDFRYAMEKHIPVLPIMMESGIDSFYSHPDKFGKLQHLNPYSQDLTEIRYEEKLKQYLESVLISDEMVQRIRAAFDAYIFLSYRKKDRRYANEIMRKIHQIPECRDIAIWYDEFLTPGEDFEENINRILNDSQMFALLVTKNLLEEANGKPNFVMAEEYPVAHRSGIEILPIEMEETDPKELRKKFEGLPACINGYDEDFEEKLLASISKIAVSVSEDDLEHLFLIGMAYLDGVDVEINRTRGVELITAAAENEYLEAMQKLRNMYYNGISVRVDYHKAVKWAEKIFTHEMRIWGQRHPNILISMRDLVVCYGAVGEYQKALKLAKRAYTLCKQILGEEHPDALLLLSLLAERYAKLGEVKKALELEERAFVLYRKVFGERHLYTLLSLANLLMRYGEIGEVAKALELGESAYIVCSKILGKKHPCTLQAMQNLSIQYADAGERKKALKLGEEVYILRNSELGEEHPDTISSLDSLSVRYGEIGEIKKALELGEKTYVIRCKILGEEHPHTILSLNNLSVRYDEIGEVKKALELGEKAYAIGCKILGEEHPDTISSLNNLSVRYGEIGETKKALELGEKTYAIRCKILGEEHPDTLKTLHNLAAQYVEAGEVRKALEFGEKVYILYNRILGEAHPNTLLSLNNVAIQNAAIGKLEKALELIEKVYILQKQILGEAHPDTLKTLHNLAAQYAKMGERKKALELGEKAYILRKQILGEVHSDTLESLNNLALYYNNIGQEEKALELGEKGYTLYKGLLGEEHPNTLLSLHNLSLYYAKIGEIEIALKLGEKAYVLGDKIWGKDHPSMKKLSIYLEELYRSVNQDRVIESLMQITGNDELGIFLEKYDKKTPHREYTIESFIEAKRESGYEMLKVVDLKNSAVKDAIKFYAKGIDPEDVIAIEEKQKKGLFRRRTEGILFTTKAIYSNSFLDGGGIRYESILCVGIHADGVQFKLKDGSLIVVDFDISNEYIVRFFQYLGF